MRGKWLMLILLPLVGAVAACGGRAGEGNASTDEAQEMEIIPKVKEPQTETVDTVGFPEEATGTPITGYQGYPEDDLVKESKDDDLVNFEGEADLDYYSDRGDDADGF